MGAIAKVIGVAEGWLWLSRDVQDRGWGRLNVKGQMSRLRLRTGEL